MLVCVWCVRTPLNILYYPFILFCMRSLKLHFNSDYLSCTTLAGYNKRKICLPKKTLLHFYLPVYVKSMFIFNWYFVSKSAGVPITAPLSAHKETKRWWLTIHWHQVDSGPTRECWRSWRGLRLLERWEVRRSKTGKNHRREVKREHEREKERERKQR